MVAVDGLVVFFAGGRMGERLAPGTRLLQQLERRP
jgi:hypothetical protein